MKIALEFEIGKSDIKVMSSDAWGISQGKAHLCHVGYAVVHHDGILRINLDTLPLSGMLLIAPDNRWA